MNEKSKAFELIEFVWNNEKTDSYLNYQESVIKRVKETWCCSLMKLCQ